MSYSISKLYIKKTTLQAFKMTLPIQAAKHETCNIKYCVYIVIRNSLFACR